MIALAIFALIVVIVCIVLIYVCDLLIGMLPGAPPQLRNIVRVVIVLIGLLVILQRAWPLVA